MAVGIRLERIHHITTATDSLANCSLTIRVNQPYMVGEIGVAPIESEDSRFTVYPAPTYGISSHDKESTKLRILSRLSTKNN